jgi:quercetin dioxygenase-like cupin family protein
VKIFTAAQQHLLLRVVEFAPGAIVEFHSHLHEQLGMDLEVEMKFFV